MVDQDGTRDGHLQCRERQLGARMIAYCQADDPVAEEVRDSGQIEPTFGLDIGDVSKPDPVPRSGNEVPIEQIRRDRQVVTTAGGPTRGGI
jgi:hypothetical protein